MAPICDWYDSRLPTDPLNTHTRGDTRWQHQSDGTVGAGAERSVTAFVSVHCGSPMGDGCVVAGECSSQQSFTAVPRVVKFWRG